MQKIQQLYLRGLDAIGSQPSWKNDWRWIALYSICIYAVVLAFRLSFAGRWDHPELWVDGERILSTHDSYFWLAKAKGVGQLAGYPLAVVASLLHETFGLRLGTIGFWAPAFMGALVGVMSYLWGWLLAGRNAGIFCGLIGSLTPGFFYRSRLGYFDTDMFTLLMPMFVAWMLAYLVSKTMRSGWFTSSSKSTPEESFSVNKYLWTAFLFGLMTRFAGIWHFDIININILFILFAVVVGVVNSAPGMRVWTIYGIIIFIVAAIPGSASMQFRLRPFDLFPIATIGLSHSMFVVLLIAAFMCFLSFVAKGRFVIFKNTWLGGTILLGVVLASGIANEPIFGVMSKLAGYLYPSVNSVSSKDVITVAPLFPSILQSIIEAKQVSLAVIMERGAFFAWLGWTSVLCSIVVTLFRPSAIFILPLVVLQLASVKLGVRFSMFGGAALIIFLGVSVYWMVDAVARRWNCRGIVGGGAQVLLATVFLFYAYSEYSRIPLTPVVTKQHAEALMQLGTESRHDSMIWTWWDWGYASQYYAGMETVSDGGKHAGRDVFPVAFAMTTDSPKKSNRMVAFSAQFSSSNPLDVGLFPAKQWDTVPRDKINATLDDQLAKADYPVQAPQYFAVTWKDLSLAKWISYFGNWNLETGETQEATVSSYDPGQLGFNLERGAVMNRQGGGGLVSDITVLNEEGAKENNYYTNRLSPQLLTKTPHLVINMVSRQSVLLDRVAYRSMMTRLLIGDPNDPEISPYFKLVVDKLPFARIYEVVQ